MASPGLINLQTDLKSLRYGSDRPYVTKDINNPPSSNQTGMQITKRIDDLSRISQMLIDRPGLKFIANQALLQQVDIQDKLQKNLDNGNRTLGGAIVRQALDTVKQTAKIVGSTLAQVPVNGTGTHFVYAFRTDTYLSPATTNSFRQFFGDGGVEGAPLALQGKPIEGEVESNFGTKISPSEFRVTAQSALDYDENVNTIIPNLPGYIYAKQGSTIIGDNVGIDGWKPYTSTGVQEKFVDRNTNTVISQSAYSDNTLQNRTRIKPTGSVVNVTNQTAITRLGTFTIPGLETTARITGSISNQNITTTTNPATEKGILQPETSTFKSGSAYYEKQKSRKINNTEKNAIKESRVNLGDQGAINSDVNYQAARRVNNYTVSSTNREEVDKLNALDITTTRPDGINEARDLAKFFFEVITPEGSTFLNFRALITSMDDSYNASWEGKRYVGRADEFYTYGGFSRDINIGFKIATATRSEMQPLYRKMVFLASTTAPTYGEFKFMRGTVVRLSLGSYFNEIPGVITSVKYNWSVDYPWEIAMGAPEGAETGVQELPMVMDCTISFKPIHDFVPQTGLYHYITSKESGKTFF